MKLDDGWHEFRKFELTKSIVYEDWTADKRKIVFREKGDSITRISDWRKGNYYAPHKKQYIECYYADFVYCDGFTKTFSNHADIAPVGEQLSLFE